jgi:hypothetical protein
MAHAFAPEQVQPEVSEPSDLGDQLPQREGRPQLTETPLVSLELERARFEPLAGFARCSYWLQSCLLSGVGNADDCALSAPACEAEPHWMQAEACCPAACFPLYQGLREQGVGRYEAFMRVYHTDLLCFPVLRQQAGR